MVYLNVVLTVVDSSDIPFVRASMAELARLARRDAGCVRFEVYHAQTDPWVFVLNEWWADDASLDAHRKTKAFVDVYLAEVVPKAERAPYPCGLLMDAEDV